VHLTLHARPQVQTTLRMQYIQEFYQVGSVVHHVTRVKLLVAREAHARVQLPQMHCAWARMQALAGKAAAHGLPTAQTPGASARHVTRHPALCRRPARAAALLSSSR
jgi:hypothetical protein